ncbi:ABC transporter dipeptide [Gluconobacter thailandicus F149-1 = NBRC 100600]|uniref:ABC transporter substrate-binding protein n=1 Tax=Gluconobacter thailandicus TaxID=257438 RepID=UPI0005DAB43D|nr:ABC transporter substrate-binding protein [Gluconobacter thailandicus]KXV52772.1 peptide ABC transporter [Gluconobacter thailandicus]GAN93199.1 ABC transporter dipeptide [Gluconobacter thailandicus F149-1 = NBRC 100600]GBR58482.1 peptide ABC transporter [Gluconobacter thailandicus F149-1 = NBRC 100600]GEL86902.1 ABC transporter substrate-binding protein [Gluconobacter thailandicus F149-1 = NBRC 100600]
MKSAFVLLSIAGLGLASSVSAEPRDTMSIGVSIEPPGLDPTRTPSEAVGTITYNNIYEGLTRLDRDGHVQPLLARAWTVSDDGRVYHFTLQDNVHFHDGAPLTCENVRFSLLRAGAADSTNPDRSFFTNIADIACPNASHVDVTLKKPHGSFTYELAWNDASILSPVSADKNVSHPIGTGPFRFQEWQRGDHVTLSRNPDYWGKAPILKTVTFRFMPDPLAASNALLAGELDAYPSFPAPEVLSRFVDHPGLRVVRGTFPFKAILALNNARRPFNDIRVRQAIAYAIDRKALVQAGADGDGTVLQSHMAPNDPDYAALPDRYPYDPERASVLLKQAGIRPGTQLTLSYPPITYARDTSEIVAAYLEQVGLIVTLQPLEWPTWLGRVFGQGAFDMTVIAHTEPHDIGIYDRESIYFHYRSPEFHALFERYEGTENPEERHRLSVAMQDRLAQDEPNVFLYSRPRDTVMNRHISGLWTDQQIAACPMADVSWEP